MQTTTNYMLKKPDPSDAYDKANDNANMDTIDTQMKANADAAAAAQANIDGHELETTQAHGAHDSQDIVITRDANGRITSVDVKKPDSTGVSRITDTLTYDAAGRLSSVNEKVFASDGVTIDSQATATLVFVNGQLDRVEVR